MGSRVRRSTSARPRSDRSSKLERRSSGPSPSRSRSSSGCRTARATSSGMRSIGRSSGTDSGGNRRPRSRPGCGRPSNGTGRTSGGGARSGRARSETTTKSNIAASASPPRGVDGTAQFAECREVGKADAPKLVPLFEAFYGQWFGEPVTSQTVQLRIDHATGIETLVVAEADGQILGFASLRLVPSLDSTPYAELSDLFVAGPYRRQGVGRRLLEFVERRARERGADRLVLTTGLKNVDAQGFYRASGFVDQALAMKKPLGNDTASGLREIRKPRRAVLWRRDEPTGTESFLLSSDEDGWHLEGIITAVLDRQPAHVRYRIVCDSAWRTLAAQVALDRAGVERELHMTVRVGGRWWVEGEEDARLRGCTDVDLEISPSTNTIPIRRLNLAVGQASAVTAAWVRFPALTVEPLTQRYTRTGANRYRYASRDFVTHIDVDDLGLVTKYEGGWSQEVAAQPDAP